MPVYNIFLHRTKILFCPFFSLALWGHLWRLPIYSVFLPMWFIKISLILDLAIPNGFCNRTFFNQLLGRRPICYLLVGSKCNNYPQTWWEHYAFLCEVLMAMGPHRSWINCSALVSHLTHLFLGKMAAISQTIFSDAFSLMKIYAFWLRFHWSLFLTELHPLRYGGWNYLSFPERQRHFGMDTCFHPTFYWVCDY